MKSFPAILILVAALTACGGAAGAAGSAGSTRADELSIGGKAVRVDVPNAASNASEMTSHQNFPGPNTTSEGVTAPVVTQNIPPRAVAVPPAGSMGCGGDLRLGKVQPMCAPQ